MPLRSVKNMLLFGSLTPTFPKEAIWKIKPEDTGTHWYSMPPTLETTTDLPIYPAPLEEISSISFSQITMKAHPIGPNPPTELATRIGKIISDGFTVMLQEELLHLALRLESPPN